MTNFHTSSFFNGLAFFRMYSLLFKELKFIFYWPLMFKLRVALAVEFSVECR